MVKFTYVGVNPIKHLGLWAQDLNVEVVVVVSSNGTEKTRGCKATTNRNVTAILNRPNIFLMLIRLYRHAQ